MRSIRHLLEKDDFCKEEIIDLLSVTDSESIELLRSSAERTLLSHRGSEVYFRGLVEFSNICTSDCYYCGIRKGNNSVKRYMLSKEQILEAARFCAFHEYGSIVLQSGERTDPQFIDFVEDVIRGIKSQTQSKSLPEGLGITLCVGEQTKETYRRFYEAGAHRYLLRVETTSQELFSSIHPETQALSSRVSALKTLKETGFILGTGVMIGLPGQTVENLADDILFFKEVDADMIGMGPYIVHPQTPMVTFKKEVDSNTENNFTLTLKMIAVTRLVLKNVNIAATTALQAIKLDGREYGLRFGANVVMPQITPGEVRKEYLLYEGKPCLDENAEQCRNCLTGRIHSVGRTVAKNSWGDRRVIKSL